LGNIFLAREQLAFFLEHAWNKWLTMETFSHLQVSILTATTFEALIARTPRATMSTSSSW
jgi:hypothetical protein